MSSINELITSAYDDGNIFAKILSGDIPNDTVYEDEDFLAFRDIAPSARYTLWLFQNNLVCGHPEILKSRQM